MLAPEKAEHGHEIFGTLIDTTERRSLEEQLSQARKMEAVGFMPLLSQAVGDGVTTELKLSAKSLRVNIDPTQLESAIPNLGVNARDAMNREGRLTISTRLVSPSKGARDGVPLVRVAVSDTGEGMPKDVARRIFEPFFTTKEVGKGSGLGLSQVYGFVSQSGGGVQVISSPGQGTTFELNLPLSDAPLARRPSAGDGSVRATGSEQILVVEDDPEVLSLCVEMLAISATAAPPLPVRRVPLSTSRATSPLTFCSPMW